MFFTAKRKKRLIALGIIAGVLAIAAIVWFVVLQSVPDVIGKNVEEACLEIDKYLDNCYLNGLNSTRIVHGKGTGALRKGIHNFLKSHPHVKSFRVGTFGEGEMGVTIVEIK